MRTWRLAALVIVAWALGLGQAWAAPAALPLTISPAKLDQGQPALLNLRLPEGARQASYRFLGREGVLVRAKDGTWLGLLAADLDTAPGGYTLEVWNGGSLAAQVQVAVQAHDYGVRSITVAQQYVAPDPAQLARHQAEAARQREVYASLAPTMLWQGPWRMPVDSEVVGVFGRRSLVNGEPRSPHGGVDLRAGMGAPILAPAAGRVAYVEDTFFSGLTVLIDHGLGVISGFRHLSAAKVRVGETVRSGQVIGLAGASGRVTGPHLHFDVHLLGARVDPLAWVKASQPLARRMGGS